MATTPTRTRLTAAERREQILDTTRDIVGAEGFHAVTIDGVARAAGITRPVVYGHFDDLPGLLEALVEREGARALGQLAEIVPTDPSEGDPTELLMAALEGFLEAVQKDPAAWRLVLMPPEGAPPALHEAIAAGRAGVGLQLAGFAAPGLGEPVGYAEPPDPELTATLLQAVSEEYARLLLQEPERYPIDRLMAHARWALGRFTGA
jgi:AcrR family transcriptional regulator